MAPTLEKILGGPETSIALLQGLAESSFDSILITDATAKGKIIYANKAFKTLTGYSPSDVIGKTPRILQGAATDKKVTKRLSAALKSGAKFEGKPTFEVYRSRRPFQNLGVALLRRATT